MKSIETLIRRGNDVGTRLVERIGNTPLLRLGRLDFAMGRGARVFGKAEWFNPGGSVKDRPVRRIIRQAEISGALTKGKVVLDATSGNAGISYAMIGAALDYGVRLVVPKNASRERVRIMESLGADLIFTDPLEGSDGAVRKAMELYEHDAERYFYANQYGNESNWRAHYEETAEEIWTQTRNAITHLIAGVGTSGTLMGTARRLRELNPRLRVVEVQPDSPFHGLEGLKHMESALRPSIYDPSAADEVVHVRTEDAQRMVRDVAREEGFLIGVSAGAALHAAKEVVQRSEGSGVFVVILPDGGERYLSDSFWEERA